MVFLIDFARGCDIALVKVVMLQWLSKGLKHELSQADVKPLG